MTESSTKTSERVSKWLSNFFNPMNSLVIYFVLFSIKNLGLKEAFQNFLPIFFLIIAPISGWIFWKVKSGEFSDTDVSDRHQRKNLYFFIAGAIIIYLMYVFFRFERVDWVLFFLLILLIILQISNYFIKSSMHTALNVFVAALMFTLDPLLGAGWIIITAAVAVSRVVLKRHTWAEVISGAVIATAISFIYLYVQIQLT
ncbi:ABC transporter permease [Kaistella solincola]|uniref:ABC transporter permease n=1 Tax=Kaistella solincola TaxID=510955 RepID=A0ABR4ZQ82_9FLAO|nr:phosphatase PAP2 family protein [Kaistella solincola]KIA83510.1 ABC transporter permease [Kaistella solincola]